MCLSIVYDETKNIPNSDSRHFSGRNEDERNIICCLCHETTSFNYNGLIVDKVRKVV